MYAKDTAKYFEHEHLCLNEAENNIAHGALTNSKRPESFVKGVYPTHLARGVQHCVYDIAGNRYLDFICGLGTNLFGYTNPDITLRVGRAIKWGFSLSLGTPSEVYYSRLFKMKFPYIDKIRILKSGSEACTAALRIARAYTGKKHVMTDGYHGWHDEFTSLTPPSKGVTDCHNYIHAIDLNRTEDVAAIIIEPVIVDWSEQRRLYLENLRKHCDKHGILLIFDETITAFRFPEYSVAGYFGIEPDLSIQGKALANGLPLVVVGGKAAIMESDYFVSSTFAGERLSLEAGIACLELIGGAYNPDHLWSRGGEFLAKMNEVLNPFIEVKGYPARGIFSGEDRIRALFFQEMCESGFLFHPSTWFLNIHLLNHLDDVVDISKSIIGRVIKGKVRFKGEIFKNSVVKG
jgi:glutamate-1-semialdehyde aminotransferase